MENFASTHDDAEKGRPPRGEDPKLDEEIKLEKSSVKSFTNLQHEKVPNHDRKPKRAGLSNHGSNNDRAPERDGPFVSECAEDASIWEQYMEQAKVSDEQLSKVLNSDLDSLLIFAGLFSAILSAFLIEVRKGLQEDLQEKTNNLLYILIQLQQNANDTPIAQPSPFRPTASTLQINTFWFLSLILSLMSALGASLAKGWVMQYASTTPGVSARDACSRHRRFIGITRWHLQMIVQSLPILLHIAFFLFSVGLIVLLRDDDMEISHLVLVLVSITAFIYIGSTLLPLFWSDCPFRTPVSILLGRLLSKLLPPRHNSASDLLKSQALSWMLLNSADDTVTLRITRAIAGLPAVPDIQDVLYNSQAASLLLRGFSKHPKESLNNLSPFHQESPLMVYLHAILRLLQTRRIDPYVTPNLQDIGRLGGLLDVYTKGFGEEDGILQLLTCVRARILLLLGDDNLKPASEDLLFNTRIPILLKSCRPEAFGTHLLSEVYVLSHPEFSKEGNLLDMVRNEDLMIQRDGHEKLLKEAKRVAMEVDRISAFGIPKLLKGLTSNSLYVRRYYAQKLRDITTNYAIFREILTRYITFEELSDLVQCEDDSIQENAINVIWILASDSRGFSRQLRQMACINLSKEQRNRPKSQYSQYWAHF
ncbi:hypothetical protein CPB86DRAFT_64917 [Serendipita vermifera]|nr:hypothetical protein CPB86DRAFT_64917 [Serendipita vermifera]